MSLLVPPVNGHGCSLLTDITTTALSVFGRASKASASSSDAWILLISTSAGANLNGHGIYPNESAVTEGRSINGLRFLPNTLEIAGVADWGAASAFAEVQPDQWFNWAAICYLNGSSLPRLKLAIRAHPDGPLLTQDLDPRFSFTNALVRYGTGHSNANPMGGRLADTIVHSGTPIVADADIEAQFDALAPQYSGQVWARQSFRVASLAAALEDESANDNDLTLHGDQLSVSNLNPAFGPVVVGTGTLPETNSSVVAPNPPSALNVQSYAANEILVGFTLGASNPAGTRYVLQYQEDGTSDWVGAADVTIAPAVANGIKSDTLYHLRMRAENEGGFSSWVQGPSQRTKKIIARGYIDPSAAGVTDVTVQLWRKPADGDVRRAGEYLFAAAAQAFLATTEVDPDTGELAARIDVQFRQVGTPLLRNNDLVVMIATAGTAPDDRWTRIFDARVREVD